MSAMWWWLWKVGRMVAVSPLCWCSWSRLKAVCSVVLVCCVFFLFLKDRKRISPVIIWLRRRERVRERERQRGHAASSNLNHEVDLSLRLGGGFTKRFAKSKSAMSWWSPQGIYKNYMYASTQEVHHFEAERWCLANVTDGQLIW